MLLPLLLVAGLYASTLSINHTEAEDSLWYLRAITYGTLEEQFHPNHLIYNAVNHLFYRGWQLLGYGDTAELPVKVLNISGGLIVLLLIYSLGVRAGLPRGLRYFAMLATAFSYGFWWYSVECETYILPIIFILLSVHRLLLIQQDFAPPRRHVLLGVFNALAILLHQQHLLLVGVVFIGYALIFFVGRRQITWGRFLSRFALYGIVGGGLTLGTYLAVASGVYHRTSLGEIGAWLSSGSQAGGYGYGLSLGSFKAIIGFTRAFVGGHSFFALPGVTALIQRLVPNYQLAEEVFLVKDFPPVKTVTLTALSLVFFVAAGLIIVHLIRRGTPRMIRFDRDHATSRHFLLVLLAAYLTLYALFNVWYLPESIEVWIALAPALTLSIAVLTVPVVRERRMPVYLGLALACLLAVNLWGSVLPQLDRAHDYWYQVNSWFIDNARPGDLVVSGAGYISDGYIAFYAHARVLSTVDAGRDLEHRFQRALTVYKPKRIFISSTVAAPPRNAAALAGQENDFARALFDKLRPDLKPEETDIWQEIYSYTAARQ
ncbi:MAG: hypothetical protein CVT63_03580 [Candidatus Anoxymicrobium japonicum]|uniref:Glycosyltransferase RgtA/B/C/D-like domain-containing protein n=1 Tax=Candidatus Anoxymicrobium japonicum TaxID=2013648 RepID=A0A2N3G6P7_9ACTN|nr:MAG: hypothetical protein CVT63_03580 [Candidatus Anoxymicrobium japonicum]